MDFQMLSGNFSNAIGAAASRLISVGSYIAGVGSVAKASAGPDQKQEQRDPELSFFSRIFGFLRGGMLLSTPFMAAAAQGSVAGATPNAQPAPARLPAFGRPGL